MNKPEIIIGGDHGFHNKDLAVAADRIRNGKGYRDLSTVCVIPTRGQIPARVVEAWMGMATPMNQPFVRMFISGLEVGEAYERALDVILQHEMLREFKYLLTLEEDNIPPPDGIIRLFNSVDEFQIVGGLYWTKGEGGQPMIYGDPQRALAFNPQIPVPDKIQECNGVGMGFTLFDMRLFTEGKIERPFFKTVQAVHEGQLQLGTQDLYFMGKARRAGYRVASDNRVRVGHYDAGRGIVW